MNPFLTGVVILWTLPMLGLIYLVIKATYECWQEQKREQRGLERLRQIAEQSMAELRVERDLEALYRLPAREPRRGA